MPSGGDPVIAELLRADVAQARDHLIAEGAGGEDLVRLDQRHLQFRVESFQRTRTGRAAKAAADHGDARSRLRRRHKGKSKRRRGDALNGLSPCDRAASAHFPKSALHRRNTFSRTSESYGHWQIYNSSAVFDLKSLNPILPRVCQGLQIGGTSEHRLIRKNDAAAFSGRRISCQAKVMFWSFSGALRMRLPVAAK